MDTAERGSDDEARQLLCALDDEDASHRVNMLRVLADDPSGLKPVRHRLRELLTDRTAALLAIPFTFGEVRWLAAHALKAELRAEGIDETVVVEDVPIPLDVQALASLSNAADITYGSGHSGMLTAFTELRDRGLLTLTTLTM